MFMHLKIDTREPKEVISAFGNSESGTVTVENLDIGDYQFWNSDQPILVVERKSIADLVSSINEGRHREQKKRLLASWPRESIMYVIEGGTVSTRGRITPQTVYSSILNTMFRDGISVFRTTSIEETISVLSKIGDKISKGDWKSQAPGNHQDDLVAQMANSKKSNYVNEKTIYRSMLCCVPGISAKTSTSIAEVFENMSALRTMLNEQRETPREAQTRLSGVGGKKIPINVVNRLIDILTVIDHTDPQIA